MGDGTGIEWTDATWNPLVGCAHVSPGCDNCYAARESAGRLSSNPTYRGLAIQTSDGPRFTGEVRTLEDRLDQPLRWRRPRRVFVNSMSDLFHPDVPDEFVWRVFDVMQQAARHTFQILTKRPQRMAAMIRDEDERQRAYEAETLDVAPFTWAERYPNVWLGTSIESNRYAFRADHLRATPAAVRFVSAEPLLGPVDGLDLEGIGWVISGGESGARARPCHPTWVADLRDRCVEAGVAFLHKQWGEWGPAGGAIDGVHHLTIDGRLFAPGERLGSDHMMRPAALRRWGKKAAGRTLDGRTWDEYPA